MSAVIATPGLMAQAATDLASIGSSLNAAHTVAAAPTLCVLPAAADEVSAGIAHLFSGYAQDYHALAGKAAAFQDQFVQHLTTGAGAYATAEAANVTSLLKSLTATVAPVAAATAAQNALIDFFSNVANFLESNPILINLIFLPFAIPIILTSIIIGAIIFIIFVPALLPLRLVVPVN